MTTIYTNNTTPFGRKVRMLAIELKLESKITWEAISPWSDSAIYDVNPLGRVPAMRKEDGSVIIESFNICEDLLAMAEDMGAKDQAEALLPSTRGDKRRKIMVQYALSTGLIETGVGRFREFNQRPESHQLAAWSDRYEAGMRKALEALNDLAKVGDFTGDINGNITLGGIAVASAISWIELRHSDLNWRIIAPKLAPVYDILSQRPSFQSTSA